MVEVTVKLWEFGDLSSGIEYYVILCTDPSGRERWFTAASSEKYDQKKAEEFLLKVQKGEWVGPGYPPAAETKVNVPSLEMIKEELLKWDSKETTKLVAMGIDGTHHWWWFVKGTLNEETSEEEKKEEGGITGGTSEKRGRTTELVPKPVGTAGGEEKVEETTQPTTYYRLVSKKTGGEVEIYVDGAGQIPCAYLEYSITVKPGTHAVYKGKDDTQFIFEIPGLDGKPKLWGARFDMNTGRIDWYIWVVPEGKNEGEWRLTRQPGNVDVRLTRVVVQWEKPKGWKQQLMAGGGFLSIPNAPEWLRKMMAQKIRSG